MSDRDSDRDLGGAPSDDPAFAMTLDGSAATTEPPAEPSPGSAELPRLDRFALIDEIGRGGMGSVYSAFDRRLDRKVAIKLLLEGAMDDPRHRTRMLREAQAMARLSHPNVIPVFEVGEVDDRVYVAMEFVDGPTLHRWQQQERPWAETLAMYVAVGRGLAAAHQQGLVHRDFKPDNVLIGGDGRPRVIDFGLARGLHEATVVTTEAPASDRPSRSGLLDSPLTQAGAVMGTPAYMAPEQLLGQPVGPASDQFSFCVALYEALYGERPGSRRTMAEVIRSIDGPIPQRPRSDVPEWVYDAIARGLALSPDDRWPSLEALLEVLDQDPADNPATGQRTRVLIVFMLLVLSVGAWPIIESMGVDTKGGVAELLWLAIGSSIPIFGGLWLWREQIARSKQTTLFVRVSIVLMLALIVHRSIAWIAGSTVATTIIADHLLFAAIAATEARSMGRWVWLTVIMAVGGALLTALRPAWAITTFGSVVTFILIVAGIGVTRRSRQHRRSLDDAVLDRWVGQALTSERTDQLLDE